MGSANSFGRHFVVRTFGESHGPALGALIEGCPAGLTFREEVLRQALARRRPGQNAEVSSRQEKDEPEILSGIFEGRTLGTPIAVVVRNQDARSEDYKNLPDRPGHADDLWREKFGHSDPRGGGRASGRETLARVIGGAFAQMLCQRLVPALAVRAAATRIGPYRLSEDELEQLSVVDMDSFPARFPSPAQKEAVSELLQRAKLDGKSFGGVARVEVLHLPRGLGQPVFHKLKADLGAAFLSVGATSGVEFGEGFAAGRAEGSEFHQRSQSPYGGQRGGISTGEPLQIDVAFKPTSSVLDVAKKGRHDPCIVPRAVPVLEAMAWLVLADHLLWTRLDRV